MTQIIFATVFVILILGATAQAFWHGSPPYSCQSVLLADTASKLLANTGSSLCVN